MLIVKRAVTLIRCFAEYKYFAASYASRVEDAAFCCRLMARQDRHGRQITHTSRRLTSENSMRYCRQPPLRYVAISVAAAADTLCHATRLAFTAFSHVATTPLKMLQLFFTWLALFDIMAEKGVAMFSKWCSPAVKRRTITPLVMVACGRCNYAATAHVLLPSPGNIYEGVNAHIPLAHR